MSRCLFSILKMNYSWTDKLQIFYFISNNMFITGLFAGLLSFASGCRTNNQKASFPTFCDLLHRMPKSMRILSVWIKHKITCCILYVLTIIPEQHISLSLGFWLFLLLVADLYHAPPEELSLRTHHAAARMNSDRDMKRKEKRKKRKQTV